MNYFLSTSVLCNGSSTLYYSQHIYAEYVTVFFYHYCSH